MQKEKIVKIVRKEGNDSKVFSARFIIIVNNAPEPLHMIDLEDVHSINIINDDKHDFDLTVSEKLVMMQKLRNLFRNLNGKIDARLSQNERHKDL